MPKFSENPYRIVETDDGPVAFVALTNKRGEIIAEAIVDMADLERVLSHPRRWHPHKTRYGIYAAARSGDGRKTVVFMHRYLLDAPDGMDVDHLDNDPLNNRRSNLRVVTRSENQQNRRGARSDSTTGVRNVYQNAAGRFYAELRLEGRPYRFGSFDTLLQGRQAAELMRAFLFPCSQEARSQQREPQPRPEA